MILGVIPARGGSKGLPRKNIRTLCGKPLIAWTIEAAQKAELLDKFIVSTEDEEIAQIAWHHEAEVLERPPELATDEASMLSVWQHVLAQINADVLVNLSPTSPIRDDDLIDRCIRRFLEVRPDSLATGFICKYVEWNDPRYKHSRRQDIPGFFYDDGNVYVVDCEIIRRGDQYGENLERMIIDREQNIDIDDEFDFWLAEQVLKKRTEAQQRALKAE